MSVHVCTYTYIHCMSVACVQCIHVYMSVSLRKSLPLSLLQVFLPPTYMSLLFLIADAVLYGLLAWYLDAVIRGINMYMTSVFFLEIFFRGGGVF